MSKYYKIYARCTQKPKKVHMITEKDALSILNDESFYNSDYGYNVKWNWVREDPNDESSDYTQECMDEFYSYVYTRLIELLNEMGFVDCGDYRIVKLEDDAEVQIPNSCYSSMASFI